MSMEEPIVTSEIEESAETANTEAPETSKFRKFAAKLDLLNRCKQIGQKMLEKKLVVSIVAAAIVAVLVLTLVLAGNSYKTPVRLLEKQNNSKKYSNFYDRSIYLLNGFLKKETKDIIEILEESDDFADVNEDLKESFEDAIEDLKDEYGKNYKYTYKIVEKEAMERADLRKFRDELREISDACKELEEDIEDLDSDDWEDLADELGISKSQSKALVRGIIAMGKVCKSAKVTAGYELSVEVTLAGSELDEPEEEEMTLYVYKVDGHWIANTGLSAINEFLYFY